VVCILRPVISLAMQKICTPKRLHRMPYRNLYGADEQASLAVGQAAPAPVRMVFLAAAASAAEPCLPPRRPRLVSLHHPAGVLASG
jgi:hypothetical protein